MEMLKSLAGQTAIVVAGCLVALYLYEQFVNKPKVTLPATAPTTTAE